MVPSKCEKYVTLLSDGVRSSPATFLLSEVAHEDDDDAHGWRVHAHMGHSFLASNDGIADTQEDAFSSLVSKLRERGYGVGPCKRVYQNGS